MNPNFNFNFFKQNQVQPNTYHSNIAMQNNLFNITIMPTDQNNQLEIVPNQQDLVD